MHYSDLSLTFKGELLQLTRRGKEKQIEDAIESFDAEKIKDILRQAARKHQFKQHFDCKHRDPCCVDAWKDQFIRFCKQYNLRYSPDDSYAYRVWVSWD
jgi:hypothetical protein